MHRRHCSLCLRGFKYSQFSHTIWSFWVPGSNYDAITALFTGFPFGVVNGKLLQSGEGGVRNGEGALRFRGTQKPSCSGSWCAPQRVAAEPGEDTTVPSMVPSRLLPSLAGTQESYINGHFSRHAFRKGRSVSFTSYLFHVNTGNLVPFWLWYSFSRHHSWYSLRSCLLRQ